MINWCVETGATFCEEFILFSTMEYLSLKKFKGAKQLVIKLFFSVAVTAFIIWMNSTFSLFSFFTLIIGSIVPALCGKVFCKAKFLSLFSIPILYFLLITIWDFMSAFIIDFTISDGFVKQIMTQQDAVRMWFVISSKCVLVTSYFIFKKFFKYKIGDFSSPFLVLMDCSSVIYYICLNIIISCILSEDIDIVKNSITVALLFMIAFLTFNILFLRFYSNEKAKRVQYKMTEYQKDILEKNYLSMNAMYRTNAKNMHDYRNNIMTLEQLIKNKNFDDAEKYIGELYEEINSNRLVRTYTGVEIVDAVLNVKVNVAAKLGIKMDIRASYPVNSTICPVDICAILGNLLDNSIEAEEKLDSSKKVITVKISYANSIVVIKTENAVAANPFEKCDVLQTTKSDKKMHGLGWTLLNQQLQNIQVICTKTAKTTFLQPILFFMPTQKQKQFNLNKNSLQQFNMTLSKRKTAQLFSCAEIFVFCLHFVCKRSFKPNVCNIHCKKHSLLFTCFNKLFACRKIWVGCHKLNSNFVGNFNTADFFF